MERRNNHHFNWIARQWRMNTIHRRIREHPGMILRMNIDLHNDLHAEISPVKPPAIQVARFILDNLLSVDNDNNPLSNLRTQYFTLSQYANEDKPYSDQAYRLAEHYMSQYEFIQENQ